METDSITFLISNVGFPITMCIYFILRFEKTIKDNTAATRELKEIIKKKN